MRPHMRMVIAGIVIGIAVLTMPTQTAAATTVAGQNTVLLKIGSDAHLVSSGAPATYRVTIANRGKVDLAGIRVVLNFDSWFRIARAEGSTSPGPSIAVWRTVLPAGKDMMFTATGAFTTIPGNVKITRATGCAFPTGPPAPLACNTATSTVTATTHEQPELWVAWIIPIGFGAAGLTALLARRRRPRQSGGPDSITATVDDSSDGIK